MKALEQMTERFFRSWNEGTISLSGTLLSGDVYVIHHSSADATIQALGDLSSGSVQHNGDDAVGLAKSISGTMTLNILCSRY